MGTTARAAAVVAACALATLTLVPVSASATGSGTSPTPSPTAPSPRPTPPPPPPPPPVNHDKTHLPVGPADTGPVVAAIQQRLIWLGEPVTLTRVMDRATLAALAHVRWKFGLAAGTTVTTTVYSKLASVSRARGVLPAACRTSGIVLCVDKTQKSLRFVRAGKVILTTDARFGSDALPTREGTFHVQRKDATHVSTLYRTSMPFAMFFSGGQAVHYSPYFHRDGYSGHSHGCVNIRSYATAGYLFAHTPIGTKVVVYRS